MFKYTFCLLLLFTVRLTHAQYSLTGRIEDGETNEPLPFATVYIDKTSIGSITDANGEFTLKFSVQNPTIVVSFVGYDPLIYPLDTSSLEKKYVFRLKPQVVELTDIKVEAKRDAEWYANLETFKANFLGTSPNARQCVILNPEVLIIDYSRKVNVLNVWARDALIIENPKLGYRINYTLDQFTYDLNQGLLRYLGYVYYQEMERSKGDHNQWAKNRRKAYNGSTVHFLKAMVNHQLEEEGFNLRTLHRTPNPNYPTDEEKKAAREKMLASGQITVSFGGSSDSFSKQPKIIETLDTNPVPYESYLGTDEKGNHLLAFEAYFQVVYTGEKEDPAYVQSISPISSRTPSFQTSVVSLTVPSTVLAPDGQPHHPLDLLYEGYWAWEKMSEMLPLDYTPD